MEELMIKMLWFHCDRNGLLIENHTNGYDLCENCALNEDNEDNDDEKIGQENNDRIIKRLSSSIIGDDYLKTMIKDIPIEMIPPSYGGKGVWKIQYGSVPKNYPVDVYHGLD